jgi:hypothetical protein
LKRLGVGTAQCRANIGPSTILWVIRAPLSLLYSSSSSSVHHVFPVGWKTLPTIDTSNLSVCCFTSAAMFVTQKTNVWRVCCGNRLQSLMLHRVQSSNLAGLFLPLTQQGGAGTVGAGSASVPRICSFCAKRQLGLLQ